jgi:hypothetical protein
MLFFTLLALTAVAGGAEAASNPLAPAMAGLLECSRPDDQKKTCRSIASYRLVEGSTYSSTATILISPQGPVTFEGTSPATVKEGNVCGVMKPEDITSGKLLVAGTPLDNAQAAPALQRMVTALGSIMNKEICVTYQRSGTGLVEKTTVDGVYQADHDEVVEWVRPDAGYVVAP